MTPHESTDAATQLPADVSSTHPKAAASTLETPPMTGSLNWEAPDLIHTHQDADGNLIMPAAWRNECDDENDNLYT